MNTATGKSPVTRSRRRKPTGLVKGALSVGLEVESGLHAEAERPQQEKRADHDQRSGDAGQSTRPEANQRDRQHEEQAIVGKDHRGLRCDNVAECKTNDGDQQPPDGDGHRGASPSASLYRVPPTGDEGQADARHHPEQGRGPSRHRQGRKRRRAVVVEHDEDVRRNIPSSAIPRVTSTPTSRAFAGAPTDEARTRPTVFVSPSIITHHPPRRHARARCHTRARTTAAGSEPTAARAQPRRAGPHRQRHDRQQSWSTGESLAELLNGGVRSGPDPRSAGSRRGHLARRVGRPVNRLRDQVLRPRADSLQIWR